MKDVIQTLGKIHNDVQVRDAVHIAIEQVTVIEICQPGSHVGFVEKGMVGLSAEKKVGIIDPFIKGYIPSGSKVWLFVYPGTITGLQHHWQHPDIDTREPKPKIVDQYSVREQLSNLNCCDCEDETDSLTKAKEIITAAGEACGGYTYEEMMDIANGYIKYGKYHHDNSEEYYNVKDWRKFWQAYEEITNIQAESLEDIPFTCAC